MCFEHAALTTPYARDQRQAVNRWNKFVLGDKYFAETARRFPKTKEEKKQQKQGFDLIHAIHEAEVSNLKPVEPDHRFEVTLEPDTFSEEKCRLFSDYQSHVHKEGPSDITRAGFKRFLCGSPLTRKEVDVDGVKKRLGSYHQCYRLDGRLIAMGVLDLLPHAVSGVYFLYHRDFEKWSFGKLSALREAALAIEGRHQYYYMGYYIHSCQKMQYKGDYKPQYVLDPMSNEWHPMDAMKPYLDKEKFVSLSTKPGTEEDESGKDNTDQIQSTVTEGTSTDTGADSDSSIDTDSFAGPDGTVWLYKSPAEAGNSGDSLFNIRIPGVLSAEDLRKLVSMDDIYISLGPSFVVRTQDLNTWSDDDDITRSDTLKGIIAELAACVGPDVAKSMAVDFSRQ
ncbi:hypothetical protein B9Z65_5934 [Elsinoe australis]|uniref:N-end rule aminoacyl transferase C-terminal domain-containing protein n=1 Tax=Elsinoe australis TaxID=40998 RepID=A0A2P7YJI3_9PEZI|nr:hypothetical protein B9Z65_5934 [Elsinoe australis]